MPVSGAPAVSVGDITVSAAGGVYGQDLAYPAGAGVAADYARMLKTGIVTTTAVTVTIDDLTVGALYEIQFWGNVEQGCGAFWHLRRVPADSTRQAPN